MKMRVGSLITKIRQEKDRLFRVRVKERADKRRYGFHKSFVNRKKDTVVYCTFEEFLKVFDRHIWYCYQAHEKVAFRAGYNDDIIFETLRFKMDNLVYVGKDMYEFLKMEEFIKNQKFELRNNVEKTLNDRLLSELQEMCDANRIPVSYHDDLDKAAGRILFMTRKIDNSLIPDSSRIEILHKYKNDFTVMAHELGHFISVSKYKDSSEERANHEGHILCRQFLSQKEYEFMLSRINICLSLMEK